MEALSHEKHPVPPRLPQIVLYNVLWLAETMVEVFGSNYKRYACCKNKKTYPL